MDRAEILANACGLLDAGNLDAAREIIIGQYPPAELSTHRGRWTEQRLLRVFIRDSFTYRYFGVRLIFPGALRMLSVLMPEEFPYHPHWKQSETHPAFWELYPTIDHVIPLARGGTEDETNIVTTSMLRNGAKANWLLEELGWPTQRAAVAADWDGMLGWFLLQWEKNEPLHQNAYLLHRADIGSSLAFCPLRPRTGSAQGLECFSGRQFVTAKVGGTDLRTVTLPSTLIRFSSFCFS